MFPVVPASPKATKGEQSSGSTPVSKLEDILFLRKHQHSLLNNKNDITANPMGVSVVLVVSKLAVCPGFGQNRVNFHRNPGRGTAGRWGLTPPGQTEPGIPYRVTSRWVPVGWGGRRGGDSLAARERAAPVRSERAGLFLSCFLLICIVVVPVSLCLLLC